MKELKKEHFSKSISYLIISQFFIKILGLIYSLYLINKPKFGDEGNAIYISGYQIFVLMLTFSTIGVPNSVSNSIAKCQSYSEMKKIFNSAISLYVTISCVASIILYVFSEWIAKNIVGIECVSNNLKILAPIIIITTLESVYIGFFNGIKQMKITAKIQFLEQLLKTIFTIVLVELLSKKTGNQSILSIGATLAVTISIIFSFIVCFFEKRKVEISLKKFDVSNIKYKVIIKKLLKFSIPISIGAMLYGINKNIDSFFIMKILGKKIGEQSARKIYGIIASKVDVLLVFPMAFNITFSTALIPNISEARKNNDFFAIKNLAKNSIFMSFSIGIASFLVFYYFSKEIFELLFSNSSDGQIFLKLSSVSVLFSVLSQTFSGILQGFQKNRISVIVSFFGMIIKIIFNIILIQHEKLLEKGIILSTVISNFFMFVLLYYELRKYLKIDFLKCFFMIFIVAIIMICNIKFLYNLNYFNLYTNIGNSLKFIIALVIGGGIYGLSILLIGKINRIYFFEKDSD